MLSSDIHYIKTTYIMKSKYVTYVYVYVRPLGDKNFILYKYNFVIR